MKYKKAILCILAVVLMLFLFLTICVFYSHIIPKPNNTAPIEDLIRHYYSQNELAMLDATIVNERGRWPFYKTLKDISKDFKLECVRDMSEYYDEYPSYVVFLSEEGQKAFVFFDKETYEVLQVALCNGFKTKADVETILEDFTSDPALYEEWDVTLGEYRMGTDSGSAVRTYYYAVEDGVFEVAFYPSGIWPVEVKGINYYSNDELLYDAAELFPNAGHMPYTLLPIDKQ